MISLSFFLSSSASGLAGQAVLGGHLCAATLTTLANCAHVCITKVTTIVPLGITIPTTAPTTATRQGHNMSGMCECIRNPSITDWYHAYARGGEGGGVHCCQCAAVLLH
jgi:hypothetical protein